MLLQSLSALCKSPGGGGSIWKYLEALVRATGVSGGFAYGFQTKLHFADDVECQHESCTPYHLLLICIQPRSHCLL